LLKTKKSMPSRSKARGQLKSINSFREVRSMTGISTRLTISPPDGKVGQDAFAVIRDTIAKMNMVAIGRVVLTRRKHIMALETKGRGLATVPCSALTHRPR
jgi:non-homologous end joining protein Ku